MKLWWVTILVAVGCVHAPAMVPREDCATDGMYLAEGEGRGDQAMFCRAPVTSQERCDVKASIASLRVKMDFSTTWRNTLIGVGYVFWIIPGVVLYFVFDHQSTGTARDADAIYEELRAQCRSTAPLPRPPVLPGPPVAPLAPGHAKLTGTTPVYCTVLAANPEVGACAFDQASCATTRAAYVAQGGAYAECRTFPDTACFLVEQPDRSQKPFCSPSVADCERQLARARQNPALRVRSAACDEYHVQP